jgi:hypothetical protein
VHYQHLLGGAIPHGPTPTPLLAGLGTDLGGLHESTGSHVPRSAAGGFVKGGEGGGGSVLPALPGTGRSSRGAAGGGKSSSPVMVGSGQQEQGLVEVGPTSMA